MNLIESLKWRSATKKFDPTKKVSTSDLEKLIEAGNLAPTSAGLQPFRLVVVNNPEVREQLTPASWGQAQITEASHLLVFGIQTNSSEELIDNYVNRVAEVRNQDITSLDGLKEMVSGFVNPMDADTRASWFAKQAYISMGTVISAAAEMKIDTCPMEGFDPTQYAEILKLNDKNIMPVCVLAIGYRSDEDVFSKMEKVRKKRNDFVLEIN